MTIIIQRIIIVEETVDMETQKVRAYGVEATVHVVAAIRGGVDGVVRHSGKNLGHSGVFLLGEGLILFLLVQHGGVFQSVVDAVQQDVGDIDGRHRHGIEHHDDEQAAEEVAHNLSHGLLDGFGNIHALSGHLHNAEAEGHHDGYERHGPEGIGHSVMAEENIDEEIGIPLVKDLGSTGKDIEKGFNEINQTQKGLQQTVQQDIDPVKQQFLQPCFHMTGTSFVFLLGVIILLGDAF